MSKRECGFDPERHTYWLGDRQLPSVTQILNALIPAWQASDWHKQRGRAVHACCAYVAKGIEFTCDDRIKGQVEACRRFLRDFRPTIIVTEEPHYSLCYQFAGTPDLVAWMPDGKEREHRTIARSAPAGDQR